MSPDIPNYSVVEITAEDGTKYVLTHRGSLYSCTCKEWKQQQIPGVRRTCNHLRQYRGEEEEEKRINTVRSEKPLQVAEAADTTPRQKGEPEDANVGFDIAVGAGEFSWTVIVPYESNIADALQKARQREFQTNFSDWSSIEAATQEVTGTIMDIRYVQTTEPPGLATTCPLSEDVLSLVWGTQKPTHLMMGSSAHSLITQALWDDWNLEEEPVKSYYCIVYKGGRPSEILFAGWFDPGK